ncbi:nonstructural protein [Capybara microvirus Cap1_SP_228]|nr:nonstructural protein [Capybara microvirus Cap1_SP_228]
MALLVFSVHDTKVGAYANPFFVRTRGEAVRSFSDACQDDSLPFKRHPGDYVLYLVGSWDETSGRIVGRETGPERVLGADEL